MFPLPVFDARHPAERPFPFRAGHLIDDVCMLGSVIIEERFDWFGLFFLEDTLPGKSGKAGSIS